MKILIAEDDVINRKLLEVILKKRNYEFTSCKNGVEVLETLKSDGTYQFAIFDWMMPELDGIGLIKKIRENKKYEGIYIILLTAKNFKEDVVTGLNAGADDYMAKPFDKEELLARIRVGERILKLQSALNERVLQLRNALEKISTLQGLIPMCAGCKKIRDDEGYWQEVEQYIMDNSEARFSHGLCPACVDKYYPEYREIKTKRTELSAPVEGDVN